MGREYTRLTEIKSLTKGEGLIITHDDFEDGNIRWIREFDTSGNLEVNTDDHIRAGAGAMHVNLTANPTVGDRNGGTRAVSWTPAGGVTLTTYWKYVQVVGARPYFRFAIIIDKGTNSVVFRIRYNVVTNIWQRETATDAWSNIPGATEKIDGNRYNKLTLVVNWIRETFTKCTSNENEHSGIKGLQAYTDVGGTVGGVALAFDIEMRDDSQQEIAYDDVILEET